MRLHHILVIFAALIMVSAMTGCQVEENAQISGLGWAKFDLNISLADEIQPASPFSLTMTSAVGATHTWPNIDDYLTYENLQVGKYEASALSGVEHTEGYNCPCYIGKVDFEVREGQQTPVTIPVALSQTIFYVYLEDGMLAAYPDCEISLHAVGGNYIVVDNSSTDPIFLLSGETYFYITLNVKDEKKITISPDMEIDTYAGGINRLFLNVEDNSLVMKCGNQTTKIALDEDLLNSNPPTISTEGFSTGEKINLFEGFPSEQPLSMLITAPVDLKAVVMTIGGTEELISDIPNECDLLDPPAKLLEKGLIIESTDKRTLKVDFSSFIEGMSINSDSRIYFIVHAIDVLKQASDVASLDVEIKNMEAVLVNQTKAEIGKNEVTLTLQLNTDNVEKQDFTVNILDEKDNVVSKAYIFDWKMDPDKHEVTMSFMVEQGVEDVPVRIDYMDKPKIFTKIHRTVPQYAIEADVYATHALIQVQSVDKNLVEAIIKYGRPYVGDQALSVTERDIDREVMVVSGLEPNHSYKMKMKVVEGAYEPQLSILTEKALSVPEGDFEDVEESFVYRHLPMGGAYSNTVFPIFNMQNECDVSVWWPQKYWASVNAKTFCQSSRNHNTWYMQPSSTIDLNTFASGAKSIKITSVGWSVNGEDIPPYTQEADQHLPYNNNVPSNIHAAAGKLFLGQYKFDPSHISEEYQEGVKFESRPSSLNGYFKYSSVNSLRTDAGLVELYLINDESTNPIIIGSAIMEFHDVTDFVAFNLPIEYSIVGLKATHLKMMFSSSTGMGSIEEEDLSVPIISDVESSSYKGSVLWIDNLSFSY